jgi:hypothetical protein
MQMVRTRQFENQHKSSTASHNSPECSSQTIGRHRVTMTAYGGSGEGGIRTPGTVSGTQHFQCCTIGHSVTSPKLDGLTSWPSRQSSCQGKPVAVPNGCGMNPSIGQQQRTSLFGRSVDPAQMKLLCGTISAVSDHSAVAASLRFAHSASRAATASTANMRVRTWRHFESRFRQIGSRFRSVSVTFFSSRMLTYLPSSSRAIASWRSSESCVCPIIAKPHSSTDHYWSFQLLLNLSISAACRLKNRALWRSVPG